MDCDGDGVEEQLVDLNGDGIFDVDAARDHDNDCINDAADPDDDNDNILDVDELDGAFGAYRYDHDNDGFWDRYDTDDDNDGLTGWFELNDGLDTTGQFDHDYDGIPDYTDDDDDGDGIPDSEENDFDLI